jgi:hypothetical protein
MTEMHLAVSEFLCLMPEACQKDKLWSITFFGLLKSREGESGVAVGEKNLLVRQRERMGE